jgi:hypothetical protein
MLAPVTSAGILFTMTGRKSIFLAAAVILALAYSALSSAAAKFGIPGGDTVEIKRCGKGTAYVYPTYIIYTIKSPYFEGQDIYVYKPRGSVSDPCSLTSRAYYYKISAGELGGAHTFLGMHGEDMFIDEWPGRDNKRLLVIDANEKSVVYFDWYADPVIDGGTLRYNRVLKAGREAEKEVPCPDAGKWKKEGLMVLYVEKMALDLKTMQETHTGEFFCESAPAVTRKAADYTIH